jgi:alkylhydroperoxidase family enzyme
MRLEPIERPPGLMMRMAFWMMRRQFGKVMMPMKVLVARMPGALRLSYELSKFELKGIRLDPELHYLIGSLTAQINGCGFCADLGRAMAIQKRMDLQKFDVLLNFRGSPLFSERERAALAYAEQATRHKRVSDATFAELRRHFADWEIAEITWINAVENYYNMVNIPLEIESDGFCAIALARRH